MRAIREWKRHIPRISKTATLQRILYPLDIPPLLPAKHVLPCVSQPARQASHRCDVRASERGETALPDEQHGDDECEEDARAQLAFGC